MFQKFSASVTRPNNATPYTAGDVIGTAATDILTLISPGVLDGGLIYRARVIDSVETTTHTFLLWLFGKAPAAQADNDQFAPTDAEMLYLLGVVPIDTAYATANNRVVVEKMDPITFWGPVYGVLTLIAGTTPAAQEVFTVQIDVEG